MRKGKRLRLKSERSDRLLSDDLYEHSLFTPAVEFAVEDLLPRAEIEFTRGYGDNHFATHHLPLYVGIGVVLASAVMMVLINGLVRRESLEPDFVIVMQAALVIINEY